MPFQVQQLVSEFTLLSGPYKTYSCIPSLYSSPYAALRFTLSEQLATYDSPHLSAFLLSITFPLSGGMPLSAIIILSLSCPALCKSRNHGRHRLMELRQIVKELHVSQQDTCIRLPALGGGRKYETIVLDFHTL
jgi:hypothetical protein